MCEKESGESRASIAGDSVRLEFNGNAQTLKVDPITTLLDVLRELGA